MSAYFATNRACCSTVSIQKIVIIVSIVLISRDVLNVSSAIISDEKNITSTTSPIQKKNTRNSKKKYYSIERKH
jgi:hypothetical protein